MNKAIKIKVSNLFKNNAMKIKDSFKRFDNSPGISENEFISILNKLDLELNNEQIICLFYSCHPTNNVLTYNHFMNEFFNEIPDINKSLDKSINLESLKLKKNLDVFSEIDKILDSHKITFKEFYDKIDPSKTGITKESIRSNLKKVFNIIINVQEADALFSSLSTDSNNKVRLQNLKDGYRKYCQY